MNTVHCAEKVDQIYTRLAWIMLLTGLMFVLKSVTAFVPSDWQAILQAVMPYWGMLISGLLIWVLAPSVFKKIKKGSLLEPEPEGFAAQMIHQALAISWGMTIGGLVMMQWLSQLWLSSQPGGLLMFHAALALMCLTASLSFLYLVHDGHEVPEQEEWD
jgi:hypothetical protein